MTESERYLDDLRRGLPLFRRRRILAEIRYHLESTVVAEKAHGLSDEDAERVAIARLGPAETLALSFATASRADNGTAPPQVIVKFGDLDVSNSQGAAALYRRIHGAALNVCSRMYVDRQSYKWHENACLQKVIGDAVIKVNRPALSAVFASRYGVSAPMVLAAAGTH